VSVQLQNVAVPSPRSCFFNWLNVLLAKFSKWGFFQCRRPFELEFCVSINRKDAPNCKMNATRKVELKEVIPNLTCHLCKGFLIEATTIIECIHSCKLYICFLCSTIIECLFLWHGLNTLNYFSVCKTCIVQHLDKSEYCPVCDVQLQSTYPLLSIRADHMLQEIVYKLVPGLFQSMYYFSLC